MTTTLASSAITFADFNLPTELNLALAGMKYETPTAVQQQAIPAAMQGKDIIASAQTGSGKTAAFGIPLICQLMEYPQARALILAPTRELAAQIASVLKQLAARTKNFDIALVIGGVGMFPQQKALRAKPQIIVATPGRLVDHLRGNNVLAGISFLVLDEADRMLDLGFAPQLRTIRQALRGERQTMLFSATFPSDISDLAKEWLVDPVRIAVDAVSKPVERITQSILEVDSRGKNEAAYSHVSSKEGSVIVFTRTKRRADRLADYLHRRGVKACRIHGDRSQGQRQEALNGFRSGRFRVLVATDIAARGIDVPEIEYVINYDLPMVAEDYLHRIGRTARAGRSGEAICFVSPEERPLWRAIERLVATEQGLTSAESRASANSLRKSSGGRGQGGAGRGPSGGGNRPRRYGSDGHRGNGAGNGGSRAPSRHSAGNRSRNQGSGGRNAEF